jgi:hypothetical protein
MLREILEQTQFLSSLKHSVSSNFLSSLDKSFPNSGISSDVIIVSKVVVARVVTEVV